MMALTPDKDAEIVLTGLFADSAQGDSAVHGLFEPIGVHTEFFCNDDGMPCVRLTKQPIATERLEYDFVNQPDLAQTFVVTCAMLGLPFHGSAKPEKQGNRPHLRTYPRTGKTGVSLA